MSAHPGGCPWGPHCPWSQGRPRWEACQRATFAGAVWAPGHSALSSMVRRAWPLRTSSSVCCFPSIPTKSFRSSGGSA